MHSSMPVAGLNTSAVSTSSFSDSADIGACTFYWLHVDAFFSFCAEIHVIDINDYDQRHSQYACWAKARKHHMLYTLRWWVSPWGQKNPPSLRAVYGDCVNLYKKGSSSSLSEAANISAVSWEMQDNASAAIPFLFEARYARALAPIYCVYCTCANCENYLRAVIISLVGKCAVNTIRGRNLVEEIL